MGENTAISWADHTMNPWIGCMKVGPACDHCYAETMMDTRYGRVQWGGPGVGVGTRVRTSEANWKKPLAWNRKAARDGTRPFVFCASLADVFDNAVDPQWRLDLFSLIRATPHLTWLLLTKRPQNIVKMWLETVKLARALVGVGGEDPSDGQLLAFYDWPKNAAFGFTAVTQEEMDRDLKHAVEAKVVLKPAFLFVSIEPMLGPIDLTYPTTLYPDGPPMCCDGRDCGCMGVPTDPPLIHYLDWVITGGESGAHARPSHPDWFRSLRDQCAAAGVAYHHKQNGEFIGGMADRVGKRIAGRLLDGVEHNARPEVIA